MAIDPKRRVVLAGMAGGAVWAVLLLWGFPAFGLYGQTELPPLTALALAFVAPGLVTAAMVGRLAQRRFFDDAIIDGDSFEPNSGAEIDQRVLTNSAEQLVLALCLWPPLAVLRDSGQDIVIALGLGFAAARVLFWVGYHRSPPLRGLGFAATFYPSLGAGAWAAALALAAI